MAHIIKEPQHHGKTYHLTPNVPITMRLIRDVLEAEVGFYAVEFYGAGERRKDTSENEDVFFQHMEVYNSYWREDPQFDTSNTRAAAPHLPCPMVDRDDVASSDSRGHRKQVQLERPGCRGNARHRKCLIDTLLIDF